MLFTGTVSRFKKSLDYRTTFNFTLTFQIEFETELEV